MKVDPRQKHTVNWILQDRAIRHAIYLQKLKTGEANRILSFLSREVYADLRRRIADRVTTLERLGTDAGPVTTGRLQELEQSIRALTQAIADIGHEKTTEGLVELAGTEAEWQSRIIKQSLPLDFEISTPSPAMLRSVVTARPMQGAIMRDWWSGVDTRLRDDVMKTLRVGIASGRTNAEIVSRLLDPGGGALAVSSRSAESIVRTSIAHVSNHARQATFEENADIVKGWTWVATLDPRTCPVCGGYDGKVFDVGAGPGMPAHWGCRCTSSPVLKSFAELGIKLRDIPKGARASMNGEVPAATYYPQWLQRQSAAVQNHALGPGRAQLFREGRVSFDRFSDDGRALNLAELRLIDWN